MAIKYLQSVRSHFRNNGSYEKQNLKVKKVNIWIFVKTRRGTITSKNDCFYNFYMQNTPLIEVSLILNYQRNVSKIFGEKILIRTTLKFLKQISKGAGN